MVNIAENVKEECSRNNISLKSLAEKLGIMPESLSRSLKGNPKLSTIISIANALGVSPSSLLKDRMGVKEGFVYTNKEVHFFSNEEEFELLRKKIFPKRGGIHF
jgi:transcriptional regulator with XRE-family HTH domain